MGKASISFCKGKGSMNHNNREFITKNVDKTKIADNITYKRESLEDAYTHCFAQAIEEYNAKQKRADRRINGVKGYMEQIRNSKNGEKLFYENVVQVGNMYDSHIRTAQGDTCKKVLNDYMEKFQERNPNLYVFNAVMHLDEKTPHLHIDYIPLASGYKQGLSVRNSLDRAYKQLGVDVSGQVNRYNNRTIHWQDREKRYIGVIMSHYNLEVEAEKGLNREHLTTEQYKAIADHIHAEVKQLPKQIETAPMMFNKERVTVKKTELKQLEQRAKLSLIHEKSTKRLETEIKEDSMEIYSYRTYVHQLAFLYAQKVKEEQEEIEKAKEMQQDYKELYKSQEKLNVIYEKLKDEDMAHKKTIENLQTQVKDFEKHVANLEEKLDSACQILTNTTKAFNMLKYDKDKGYKANFNEKQSILFNAIENYVKQFLKLENKMIMVEDVEKCVGFSKGISNHIQHQELIIKEAYLSRNRSKNRDLDRER